MAGGGAAQVCCGIHIKSKYEVSKGEWSMSKRHADNPPPAHASRTPWCLSSYDHKRGSDTVFPTGKERTGRELLHIRSGSAAAADHTPICQILPPGKKKKRIIIESWRAASEEDLISRLLSSPQWLWGQGQPWSPPCAAPFKGRRIH